MDAWSKEQLEVNVVSFRYHDIFIYTFIQPMKSIGNIKSNAIYNPNEVRNPPPANLMDAGRDGELERYIRCESQVDD